MSEWSSSPLADLLEDDRKISYGVVQPGMHVGDGVPIVRVRDVRDGRVDTSNPLRVSQDIESAYERTRLRGGELLLTLVGTVGEAAVAGEQLAGWNTARAVAVIPVSKEVGSYWVKLALATPEVRAIIDSRLNTTVQATLNLRDVSQLPILLPPKPTRERIVGVIGSLDDKIELNRRMNRTLEAIARAIFKSWFVDFDPVRAKAEGREPVGMDAETAALFPDSFQDSPLGKIPKGWEIKAFSEVVEINPSRTLKKGAIAPYVNMASLPIAGSQLEGPPGSREYKSGSRFRNGDVLFARITPCLENGKTVLVDFLGEEEIGAGSTEFLVFGPRVVGPYFAYCASRWSALREHAIASMTGTSGRQRVQKGAFDHFEMAVPAQESFEAFETRVAPFFATQRNASQETRCLSETRESLLPRLLSGELAATTGEQT